VRAANNTQFVVNHMGDPDIHDRQMSSWAAAMAALARLPNVVVKVRVKRGGQRVPHMVGTYSWRSF
jgi:predicted TIM-barrel fold metal-dependent hydrolase